MGQAGAGQGGGGGVVFAFCIDKPLDLCVRKGPSESNKFDNWRCGQTIGP